MDLQETFINNNLPVCVQLFLPANAANVNGIINGNITWSAIFSYSTSPDYSIGSYKIRDIQIGHWIGGQNGLAWRIYDKQYSDELKQYIFYMEDVNNYCANIASSQDGIPQSDSFFISFELNDDGQPLVFNIDSFFKNLQNVPVDMITRFSTFNVFKDYIGVYQLNHGFTIGDLISLESSTGIYIKILDTSTSTYVLGIVTNTSQNAFNYKPYGIYYSNINRVFPNITFPSNISPGDLLYYIQDTYTKQAPTNPTTPSWIYLGKDNSGLDKGILINQIGQINRSQNTNTFIDVSLSNINIGNNINVGNALYVLGQGVIQQDTTLGSRLLVSGDVSMNSRLVVGSDIKANGSLYIFGQGIIYQDVTAKSRVFIQQDVSMNSRLFVGNDVSFTGSFYVVKKTILNQDVSMNSRLFVGSDVSINGNLYSLGNTILNKDVSMNSRLFVGNDASFSGNFYILGKTILNQDVSMNSRFFVGNDVSINGNLYSLGNTILNKDVSMNSRLYVGSDIKTNGSMYILGQGIIYQDLIAKSRVFIQQDVSMGSRLFVGNDVSFNRNVYVFGNSILNGDVSLNSRLFLSGDASFNSNVFIRNNLYIDGYVVQWK